jgi:hypothetical protein
VNVCECGFNTYLLIVEIAKYFIVFIGQEEFFSFTSCSSLLIIILREDQSCDSHVTSMCTFLGGEYKGVPLLVRIKIDNQRWMGVAGAQTFQEVHRISKSL